MGLTEPNESTDDRSRARAAWVVGLAAGIVITRWLYVAYGIVALGVEPRFDELFYHQAGCSISRGSGFPPTASWMPLYPVFLSAFYRFFGCDPIVGYAANVALAVVSCMALVSWTARLADRRRAFIAGVVYLCFPTALFYTGRLANENLATPLALGSIWMLAAWRSRLTHSRALAIGVLVALQTLTRAEFVLSLPLIVFFLYTGSSAKRRLAPCIALILGFGLTMSPWWVRNYRFFGEFVPFSTIGGSTFLDGNNPYVQGNDPYTGRPGDWVSENVRRSVHPAGTGLAEIEHSRRDRARALEWIKNNPWPFARLLPKKLQELWSAGTVFLFQDRTHHVYLERWVPVLFMGVLIAAGWAGLILLPISDAKLAFLILFVQTHVVALMFFGYDRYRFPLIVAWIGIAAAVKVSRREVSIGQLLAWVALLTFLAPRWLRVLIEFVPRLDFLGPLAV